MSAALQKDVARERERMAWELRQQFKTHQEIATILGVSQPAVTKILKRVNRRAFDQLTEMVAEKKAEQAGQLEYIAQEAMRAWERSKQPTRNVSSKTRKKVGSKAGVEEKGVQTETRDGNPAYLQKAMDALSDIRAILGMDAPIKLANEDWHIQAIQDIQAGNITFEALVEAFDEATATRLFTESGKTIPTGQSPPLIQ